jgi:hypothetical protein
MSNYSSFAAWTALSLFLICYILFIVRLFRVDAKGRRRRCCMMDFVWIPLGGLTGVTLVGVFLHVF